MQKLWDKTWKDRRGRVVIWQTPNAWLIAWAGLTTLSLTFGGRLADIMSWSGSGALIIWSLLEILKGTNYFRRVLGLLVLAFAVASLLNNL